MSDLSTFDEDCEEQRVAENLMRHMNAKFHPYTIAAIGAAVAVLNDDVEDEEDVEEILSESCLVFFEYTIAFMHRVGQTEQESLWKTSIDIGREIYGDERTQVAASLALEHLREFEDEHEQGCENELFDNSRKLN